MFLSSAAKKLSCLKSIGPGLMMAGAAIGVSHLVQSTRAGADYGFSLILLVLVVNILKYPFFEFGHRFAAATGQNLLQGYRQLGKRYLYIFLVLNTITAIISIAGVTFVTAALASLIFPQNLNVTMLSFICMSLCAGLIMIGHYKWLDRIIKFMMSILFITTIIAFTTAAIHGPVMPENFQSPSPWTLASLPFLIALMGWMPAPIELSVWQSLWIQANDENKANKITMQSARLDFNLGYCLTTFLALIFLAMGALIMHGSDEVFSNSGPTFAAQLVQMYSNVLGNWTKSIVAIVAMFTMLSTTLTVIDAYPRSLAAGMKIAFPEMKISQRKLQSFWIIVCCIIALWFIQSFMNHFKQMIDLATTIAFLAAPLFAFLNYKLLTSKFTPQIYHPSKLMKGLSQLGILFLFVFGCIYLVELRFGAM